MSLIFDGALSKEDVKAAGADIISTLKSTDEIFRNVRCNVVFWLSDEKITHEPTAAAVVQMGRCFENWEQVTGQTADSKVGQADKAAPKRMEILTADLKKFEARSRLLILVTDGNYVTEDKDALQQNLNPFLKYRLLIVTPEKIWQGKYL